MCDPAGVGYHMNMVKTPQCNVRAVTSLIEKYVPDAGLESDAGAELSFVLPHESSGRCVRRFLFTIWVFFKELSLFIEL